jgi:LacI family transcriptional regulator
VKRVAIFVETSLASGRHILEGISNYVRGRSDWEVCQYAGQLGSFSFAMAENWTGDGAIARITDEGMLRSLQGRGFPVVDVLGNSESSALPVVKSDDRAIGSTIARNFLEKGYTEVAFYGLNDERWARERKEGFAAVARDAACGCAELAFARSDLDRMDTQSWLVKTAGWLRALPKPCGLFVVSDQFAPLLFEAARRAQLKIPEEMSVLGVDNDAPFCSLCNPPLSSLEPNHLQVGYHAAAFLDAWMRDGAMPGQVIEVPPGRIFERRSSSELAVNDAALAAALHEISLRACSGLSVDEVARAAGTSRSVIQRKFRQTLKRTVGESILAVKLRSARELLMDTQHSIPRIAELAGFGSQEYLTYVLKKHWQTTPAKLRKQMRADG